MAFSPSEAAEPLEAHAYHISALSASKHRNLVFLTMFAGIFLQMMQRVAMSTVVVGSTGIASEFGWSNIDVAMVLSAFAYGYTLGQVPAGCATFRLGERLMFFSLGVATVISMLTPLCAYGGIRLMVAMRAAIGFAQSPLWVVSVSLASHWARPTERSQLLSFVLAGFFLATFAGVFSATVLMATFGWRSVFVSFGALGLLWLPMWHRYGFSRPSEHPRLTSKELAYFEQTPAEVYLPKTQPHFAWVVLLRQRALWAVIVSAGCFGFANSILVNFGMRYMHDTLHVDLKVAGFLSSCPEVVTAVLQVVAAWISDTMLRRGYDVTVVRKVFLVGPGLLAALSITFLGSGSCGPGTSVLLIAIVMSTQGPMNVALTAGIVDMAGECASVVSGVCNFSSTFMNAAAVSIAGLLLDRDDCPVARSKESHKAVQDSCGSAWSTLFNLVGLCLLVKIVVYALFASSEPLQLWPSSSFGEFDSEDIAEEGIPLLPSS